MKNDQIGDISLCGTADKIVKTLNQSLDHSRSLSQVVNVVMDVVMTLQLG